ncbi:MAG: hypothetical protein KGI54_11555 [Pseudomonadota bacterium]|nr:hypothetical protein [Pseudomonadota bacterium]
MPRKDKEAHKQYCRELLCNDCNAALGFAKENINTLQKMITYLEKHNA